MSKDHPHKPKITKQPLVLKIQRVRTERHGKPVTERKRFVVTDPVTNLVTIVWRQVPVTEARERKVPAGSTVASGERNVVVSSKKKALPPDKGGKK